MLYKPFSISVSSRAAEILSPSPRTSSQAPPDPFLGTPITMSSKRKSRYSQKSYIIPQVKHVVHT